MSAGACLLRLLALLVTAAFVAVAVGLLLLIDVQQNLLNPDTYKRALAQQQVYQRLSQVFAEQLAMSYGEQSARHRAASASGSNANRDLDGLLTNAAFGHLTLKDWQFIINEIAPPDWVQRQTERAIDDVFYALDSGAGPPKVRVSLVELKTRVAGDGGKRIVERIVSSWPKCDANQLAGWSENPPGSLAELPVCRPSSQSESLLLRQMDASAQMVASRTPNEIVLDQLTAADTGAGFTEEIQSLQAPRQRLLAIATWGWVVPVGLLLLIVALAVRSWRDLALWWGLPMLLAGGVTLALAFSLTEVIRLIFEGAVRQDTFSTSLAGQLGVEVLMQLARVLTDWLKWAGAIISGVGFIMVAVSLVLPPGASRALPSEGPYSQQSPQTWV